MEEQHDQPADPIPTPTPAGADPAALPDPPPLLTGNDLAALRRATGEAQARTEPVEVSPESHERRSAAASRAQAGNFKRLRHGRRSGRAGLAITHLAGGERSIEADLHLLRKALEGECRRVLSLPDDAPIPLAVHSRIDLAVSYERVHRLAGRLAAKAKDAAQRMEFEKSAVWGAQQRHAMIEKLTGGKGESADPPDVWAQFDAMRNRQAAQARQAGSGRSAVAGASGDAARDQGGCGDE